MLNEKLKLNPRLFDADVEMLSTRDGYGEGLLLLGEKNKNVVVLTADLSESTRADGFAKKFPERFIELGVAEQNLATVAAGMGISGKIAFISSYATFSPGRNWEQIRTTIAFNDSNVKIAGHHAGFSAGPDGATHQALEDVALMRVLPNMKVFVPCDALEARKATFSAAQIWGPVYLRFGREKTPIFTTEGTPFIPGKLEVFWDSPRPAVAIIASGPIIGEALKAALELKKRKIEVVVANCHTISPIDKDGIEALAKKAGAIVTVEEHQVRGGLGGAVSEIVCGANPVPMEFIGVKNAFGESGTPAELWQKHGMTARDIVSAARVAIRRKK